MGSEMCIRDRVYSCLRLTNNGEPYSFEGVSDFDVAFIITDALNGRIKLLKYRAFNSGEVLNKDFELPNCSGELEISTGTYSDTLQVDATFYEFDFKLIDSSSDELVLVSSREIPLR